MRRTSVCIGLILAIVLSCYYEPPYPDETYVDISESYIDVDLLTIDTETGSLTSSEQALRSKVVPLIWKETYGKTTVASDRFFSLIPVFGTQILVENPASYTTQFWIDAHALFYLSVDASGKTALTRMSDQGIYSMCIPIPGASSKILTTGEYSDSPIRILDCSKADSISIERTIEKRELARYSDRSLTGIVPVPGGYLVSYRDTGLACGLLALYTPDFQPIRFSAIPYSCKLKPTATMAGSNYLAVIAAEPAYGQATETATILEVTPEGVIVAETPVEYPKNAWIHWVGSRLFAFTDGIAVFNAGTGSFDPVPGIVTAEFARIILFPSGRIALLKLLPQGHPDYPGVSFEIRDLDGASLGGGSVKASLPSAGSGAPQAFLLGAASRGDELVVALAGYRSK